MFTAYAMRVMSTASAIERFVNTMQHAEVGMSAAQPEGNRVQRWWWLCGGKGVSSK